MKLKILFMLGCCSALIAGNITSLIAQSEWTVFNTSNSPLPDNLVIELEIGKNDTLYVGTNSGVVSYANGSWATYPGLPDNGKIRALALDNENNLWAGTRLGGLGVYKNNAWDIFTTSNSGIAGNAIYSLAIEDTLKWIGTGFDGVSRYDNNNWTTYNSSGSSLPDNYVEAISIDSSGKKWFGTYYGGAASFDGLNWELYNTGNSGLPDNTVKSILIGNQKIYFGTYSGLAVLENSNWTIYNTSNSLLPSDKIISLEHDLNNNIYISTFGGGVAYFDGTDWKIFNESNSGLPNDTVQALKLTKKGNLWIGTKQGVAYKVLPPLAEFEHEVEYLQSKFTYTGSANAQSWSWDMGNGVILTDTNHTYNYPQSGTYQVCLTVSNVAGSDQLCDSVTVVDSVSGITENMENIQVNIYPNPVKNIATLEFSTLNTVSNLNFVMTNILGKKLNVPIQKNNNKIVILRDNLPAGMYYFLLFENNQVLKTGKLIFE